MRRNEPETLTDVQTITLFVADFMPIGCSISLFLMFKRFDTVEMMYVVCIAVLATGALAFSILPVCQHLMRLYYNGQEVLFDQNGRFTAADITSFFLSSILVCLWILTDNVHLMNVLGMCLSVAGIALIPLPNLKFGTVLLVGFLIYDVFWVFVSPYVFGTNVMVEVATCQASNPVCILSEKFGFTSFVEAPKLSLPNKLVFPSMGNSGHPSMLGLGDIIIPGLLISFAYRYDAYKQLTQLPVYRRVVAQSFIQRLPYFQTLLIGYCLGLLMATILSEVFKAAQPALLYLVPFTLLPLLTVAYLKGDLGRMWQFEKRQPPFWMRM